MSDDEHEDDGYVAPPKAGLNELLSRDQDDESLRKYKESLLGAAASSYTPPADDDRRVVITRMRVLFRDDALPTIDFDGLDEPSKLASLAAETIELVEGCKYKIEVTFRVQHEIVSGLSYVNTVTRKGVRVDRTKTMIGSFGPQAEPHIALFPRIGYDECPAGMLARGDYKSKSRFVDDDNKEYLAYDYNFKIVKA